MAVPSTAAARLLAGSREPVRVATTANITLSGLQTIDGVTVVAGDRVLVKNQTAATANGIYDASAGTWYRSADARQSRTINKGVTVAVQSGTVSGGASFAFNTLDPDIGDDAISIISYISASILVDVQGAAASAAAAAATAASLSSPTVFSYSTNAAAAAATIPASVQSFRTSGYTTVGDGGHGLYKYVASGGQITDAGGRHWELVPDVIGVNIKQFGALDDGTTDNRLTIQAAIDFAQARYIDTVIPRTTTGFAMGYTTSGGNSYSLILNGNSSLVGFGSESILMTMASNISTNVIHILPALQAASNFRCGSFCIFGTAAVGGRRQGRHAIYIDTRIASRGLAKPIFENLHIGQGFVDATSTTVPGVGNAIYHDNNETNNLNGGVFGMIIRDCRDLGGGVAMYLTGDQNMIINCIISGSNPSGGKSIGVDVALCLSGGGAGFFTMQDITIVNYGGAFRIQSAINFIAERVYIECFTSGVGIPFTRSAADVAAGRAATGYALAVVDSGSTTIGGGRISGCRFAPAGGVSTLIQCALYIGNAQAVTVTDDNRFYAAVGTDYAVEMGSYSFDCIVHNPRASDYSALSYKVWDSGTRNRWNGQLALTLGTGVTNSGAGFPNATMYRNSSGRYWLEGVVGKTTFTSGFLMFTAIPAGWRPAAHHLFPVVATSGAGVIGAITVQSDGQIIYSGANATIVDISGCSWHAALTPVI